MADRFCLILPNIRSGHNVGAMFRTADGAGVDRIFLTGYSPRPPHPQVDKVSLGAEKWLPWEHRKLTRPLVKKLRRSGFRLVALERTPKSVSIYEWKPVFPVALIVGNEKTGVPKNLLSQCDVVVHLPMAGKKESLNVSVAAGIALYHIASFKKG